jgi:biopolymer transport protein ExbB
MLDFLAKGGVLMFPILGGLVVGLTIIIERAFNLRFNRIIDKKLFLTVKDKLANKEYKDAMELVKVSASPVVATVLTEAIENRDLSERELREIIETAGKKAVKKLEKYLPTLATIISVEPLLGLLGTVTGMIKVFRVISTAGVGKAEMLAGGISEALITTATGLSIAIPLLVFYNYYSEKAENITIELEKQVLTIFKKLKNS